MTLESTYLGIDLGSTSCRLCLYTSVTHRMIEIECPDRGKVRNSFDPGDFSSRCYPFNIGSKVYKGNTEDRDSQAASLKPVLLLLSGLPEQELHPLIIEYPVAQKILNNLHSTTFRRRLDTGVQQLFRILWKATVEVCMEKELCITGIGVTTPQQWPSQVDKLYEQVILESFCARTSAYLRINTESIYFLGETQALAHFLFHHHANKVWVRGFEEDVLLILDFGGQNLNASMYHVDYTADNKRAYFEIGYSRGFVGGSEQFDYYIGEYCEQHIREQQGIVIPHSVKQGFINQFHTKKQELGRDFQYEDEDHVLRLSWANFVVTLNPQIIESAFNKALGDPLVQADNMISEASQVMTGRGNRGPWAIVTGGTSRSKALQARLTNMCKTRGFRTPMFVDDDKNKVSTRFPSHSIAKGAAYAMANPLTVEEFLGRSAIGLQMRQSDANMWDSESQVLFFKGEVHERTIQIHDHDELKLICNPAPTGMLSGHSIVSTTAYDLHPLGFFRRGTLTVSVALSGAAGNVSLDVYLSWNPDFPDPHPDEWERGLMKLPLFADRSTCCVLVELSRVESMPPPSCTMGPPPEGVASQPDRIEVDVSSNLRMGSYRRKAAQKAASMATILEEEDWGDIIMPERRKKKADDDWKYTPGNERRRRWIENMGRAELAKARRQKRKEARTF